MMTAKHNNNSFDKQKFTAFFFLLVYSTKIECSLFELTFLFYLNLLKMPMSQSHFFQDL